MKSKDSKNGVAVIIVLGMLALLMMMGVAFSVSMRIERRSAGNYSHSVATKNMVWAALARAMDDIEVEMTQDGGHVYPPFKVLESLGSSGCEKVNLGRGDALDYIPGALHSEVIPSAWTNFNITWSSGGGTITNEPGRYAYLILNCSDFIDANYAGGDGRGGGTNVNELQIEDFPEIDNWGNFKIDRENDMRYETVQELNELNIGISASTNLVTYSRYPLGILLNGGTVNAVTSNVQLVNLSGDETALVGKENEIITALDSAVPGGDSEAIYTNLLDYIDKDCIPRSLTSACTERVPMINEIRMNRVRLTRTATAEFEIRAQVNIENIYPFESRINHSFSTEGVLELTLSPAGGAQQVTNISFSVNAGYQVAPVANYYSVNADVRATFSSAIITNDFGAHLLGITNIVNEASEGFVARTPVDLVDIDPTDTGDYFELETSAPVVLAAVGNSQTINNDKSLEARDPRYNWLAGDNTMWRSPISVDHTIGVINTRATQAFDSRASGNRARIEMDESMHVSDRGHLASVGELGNLLRGSGIWETIRLFTQTVLSNPTKVAQRDEIYKYFTLSSNTVQRGLVNLNTMESAVLNAAITNMPSKYPESGTQISDDDVVAIRDMIFDWRNAGNEFYNIDDLAGVDWRISKPVGDPLKDRSDLELEAMMAYSSGLLGTRQNLFAIIIAASPVTANMGTFAATQGSAVTSGGKRAIVYVWRDPFPDADDKHKCFVQFFKWL